MTTSDRLRADVAELQASMASLRHQLHERPEIGLHLPETQQAVLDALDGLPLEISAGQSSTSVTAVLRGTAGRSDSPPAILLRADMDALPVHEMTDLDFRSSIEGAMHACGHDMHVAMLAGAARLLSAHRDALHGDVVFMFQPGEEGSDGASHMIREGVLDAAGPRVRRAYAMHVIAAGLPRYQFSTRPGAMMAAADTLSVTVHGSGGHGSAPHRAKDPITVAAEMVTALQTMVTRQFDVFDPVVLTVGSFHAGTRRNIIPAEARFDATVRTFSHAAQAKIQDSAVRLCEAIAAAHGLSAEATYVVGYPPTINDAGQAEFAAGAVADVFGSERFTLMPAPDAGAEDFSRVLEEVPGCYLYLGACPHEEWDTADDNHSAFAQFDDSVMPDGCLLYAELAIRALHDLRSR